jgi:hypothetical protein
MAESFVFDPTEDLDKELREINPGFKTYAKEGFGQLSRIDPGMFLDFAVFLADHTRSGRAGPATMRAIAQRFGLEDVQPSLIATVNFYVGLLTAHPKVTPERFASALLNADFLSERDRPTFLELAKVIAANRVELLQTTTRANLGAALLPSLDNFDWLVDVRPKITVKGVSLAIPVALLRLRSDNDEEMLFQVSKPELDLFIKDLQLVLAEMEQVEGWIEKAPSSVE